MRSILTVTQAASSYNLTTLEDVKDELGIQNSASDGKLSRWIAAASRAFARECNRVFPIETLSEQIRQDHHRRPTDLRHEELTLSRWPVVSIASVTEGDADTPLVAGTDYEADNPAGQIFRLDGAGHRCRWWACKVTVAYQAGYATIPADVADAVITMLRYRWYGSSRDPNLRSLQIFDVSTEVYQVGAGATDAWNLPADVVDKYREVRV